MTSKRRNDKRPFERARPTRDPKFRILVVCEGKLTEPKYLRDFQHHHRNPRVHVHVHGEVGVPMTVVQLAATERSQADRKAKAERDANLKFDEVWAVFDVDDHPHLEEAIELAARENVKVALSNPCFELWALLHFEDQRAHIARAKLRGRLQQHMKGYDKELDFSKLRGNYEAALARAKELHRIARTNGQSRPNPSTDAYLLMETIRTK
jgi:hypothetical protein